MVTDQTTYDRTVLYDTFDVTRQVKAGDANVVAAELGRGWHGVTTPTEWYWHLAPYVGAPRMRARLVVKYDRRSPRRVRHRRSWETADGPDHVRLRVLRREVRRPLAAETLGEWRAGATAVTGLVGPATVMLEPGAVQLPSPAATAASPTTRRPAGFIPAELRAAESPTGPCHRGTCVRASLTETAPGLGRHVADFGQILTGFPVLTLSGVRPSAARADRPPARRQRS